MGNQSSSTAVNCFKTNYLQIFKLETMEYTRRKSLQFVEVQCSVQKDVDIRREADKL